MPHSIQSQGGTGATRREDGDANTKQSWIMGVCGGIAVAVVSAIILNKTAKQNYEYGVTDKIEYDFDKIIAYNRWLDDLLKLAQLGERFTFRCNHAIRQQSDPPADDYNFPAWGIEGDRNPLWPRLSKEVSALALLTRHVRKGNNAMTEWSVYLIETDALAPAIQSARSIRRGGVKISLQLVDPAGKVQSSIYGREFDGDGLPDDADMFRIKIWHVSPFGFRWGSFIGDRTFGLPGITNAQIKLSLQDLKNEIKVQLKVDRSEP